MTKKQLADKITDVLFNIYPVSECSLEAVDPVQLIVATRLSAQCTDVRVNMVTPVLFGRFPDAAALAEAPAKEIEECIRSCGLYKTKARDIKNMCRVIRDEYGGALPDNIDLLTTLPGVGRKTANLIMGEVFHKPAIVADTHCIRISNRLGLCDSRDPLKVERQLREVIDPERSLGFCHRLVQHGREVCRAKNPNCAGCALSVLCSGSGHKENDGQ
ncbi:MAG: endonuclease III [Clostridia bacterium]|nr:endonuclease III [Clostridia bacterium]